MPEHFRQEFLREISQKLMEELKRRSCIQSSDDSLPHLDSHFVLGHLGDRLQFMKWTSCLPLSLPRDTASINSMSLLFLVPFYSLVIDPSAVAAMHIYNAVSATGIVSTSKGAIFQKINYFDRIRGVHCHSIRIFFG